MKIKKSIIYLSLSVLTLTACSDSHSYVSNDPDAAPNAPVCYDVNDLYKSYGLFFKPANGWVGDPMPYYEGGKFHIFYLHDTRPAGDTFHPWYLTTTTDLVNYTDNGEAIPCGADNSQEDALGTGSVFKHNGTYYTFYTAHNANLDPKEKIYLATSPDLKTWTKHSDFSLQASDGYDRNEFRDPIILEENGVFKMIISTRADIGGGVWKGVLAQYTSSDLLNWTLDSDFFYVDDEAYMVECPDIFTEGGYQYLIYSGIDDRLVHYKYRPTGTASWITPTHSALDGIAFYAGKTASDGTNRYLFAWCPTRENNVDNTAYSWGGSLVAHQLVFNSDATLSVTIPESISNGFATSKRPKIAGSSNNVTASDSYTLSATDDEQGYIVFDREEGAYKISTTITASTSTSFGISLGACGNRREVYNLVFDTENAVLKLRKDLRLDGTTETITSVALPIATNKQYKINVLVENSVCVIYVNDQIALTNRIYKMAENPWGIFVNNGEAIFSNLLLKK